MRSATLRERLGIAVCVLGVLGAVATGFVEWRMHGPYGRSHPRVWRSADAHTGHAVIAFNARGYGRPNVWCVLDGTRLVRMEFDQSGDGVIDRWEYYASDGTLDRVFQRDASGGRVLVASEPP